MFRWEWMSLLFYSHASIPVIRSRTLCRSIVCMVCIFYFLSQENAEGSREKTKKVLVVPYDIRIPKIRIGTRQASQLRTHRIVVRIDSWGPDSQYPDGHFVRSIGPIGDIETETAVIMIENSLQCPPFSRALLNGEWCSDRFSRCVLPQICQWVYFSCTMSNVMLLSMYIPCAVLYTVSIVLLSLD